MLQCCTFHINISCGLGSNTPDDENDLQTWKKFKEIERLFSSYHRTSPLWWWIGSVWATAATALHQVIQDNSDMPDDLQQNSLEIKEDPLAYLGILVDCIQQWDRTSVIRDSVISGVLPLQGSDIDLDSKAEKIIINYNDIRWANLVRDFLNDALADWTQILTVLP